MVLELLASSRSPTSFYFEFIAIGQTFLPLQLFLHATVCIDILECSLKDGIEDYA